VEDKALGDTVSQETREKEWALFGRCEFVTAEGTRCRYVKTEHNFHLCIGKDD
jgi:hypothetical protein